MYYYEVCGQGKEKYFCTQNLSESFAIVFKRNSEVQEGSKTSMIGWNESMKMEVITVKVKANLKELNIFK